MSQKVDGRQGQPQLVRDLLGTIKAPYVSSLRAQARYGASSVTGNLSSSQQSARRFHSGQAQENAVRFFFTLVSAFIVLVHMVFDVTDDSSEF